ncbi:MAG TPA: TolC family protein [Nitrospirae bacterium]|nr:TolC family protein [Nitrospirota bacterium]
MSLFFRLHISFLYLFLVFCAGHSSAQETAGVSISLDEAVSAALKNNFEIILQRVATDIARHDTTIADSGFDTIFGAEVNTESTRNPGISVFSDPEITETDLMNSSVSLSRKSYLGGQYKLSLDVGRFETNSTFQSINPSYSSALKLEIAQPLLKNAGKKANRWRILISQNNESISFQRLRAKLNDTITEISETYWEYVFLTENLKVSQEFLERARDLERRVRVQVEVGSLAPIEIIQAQSSVASREELVIEAENNVDAMGDRLLRLMNPSDDSPIWLSRIKPEDDPEMPYKAFDLRESTAAALEKRPEISIAKKELENQNIELVYYKNQKWPSLDLVGSFRLNGVRGPARPIASFSTGEILVSSLDGGLYNSLSDAYSGEYYDYKIGLRLTYPLGNRSAKGALAKASLYAKTSLIKLKSLERDVTLEVRNEARNVEKSIKQIDASSAARLLAEKKLEAEIRKFEVGSSTSFNVLEFQKDLAAERSHELRAKVEYRKAVARLHKATGDTLDASGISFESFKNK